MGWASVLGWETHKEHPSADGRRGTESVLERLGAHAVLGIPCRASDPQSASCNGYELQLLGLGSLQWWELELLQWP